MTEIIYSAEAATESAEAAPILAEAPAGVIEREDLLGKEIFEELIIEDFTIDGICGVY